MRMTTVMMREVRGGKREVALTNELIDNKPGPIGSCIM